jgi:hypothetical protein
MSESILLTDEKIKARNNVETELSLAIYKIQNKYDLTGLEMNYVMIEILKADIWNTALALAK